MKKERKEYLEIIRGLKGDEEGRRKAADYVRGIMESGRPCRQMPESLFWGFDEPETVSFINGILGSFMRDNDSGAEEK